MKRADQKLLQKVRRKLLFTYGIIFLLTVGSVSVVGYQYVLGNIVKEIDIQVALEQKNIETFLNEEKLRLDHLAREIRSSADLEQAKRVLEEYTIANNNTIAYYIGLVDGRSYFGDGWVAPSDYNIKNTPWYQGAVANIGESIDTAPYVDLMTGEIVITIAKAMTSESGELIGVAAVDLFLTEIIEEANRSELKIENYNVLLDDEGNILNHQNAEYLPLTGEILNIRDLHTQHEKELYEKLIGQDGGIEIAPDYDGISKLFVLKQLDNGWYMAIVVAQSLLFAMVMELLIMIIVMVIAIFIIIYLVTSVTVKKIIQPILVLAQDIERIAQGDLTVQNAIQRDDELGKLAQNTNSMVQSTREMIASTKELSLSVDDSMKKVQGLSLNNDEAMETVADIITHIANDGELHTEMYQGVSINMQRLAHEFEKVENQAVGVVESVKEVVKLSTDIKTDVDTLQTDSEKVNQLMKGAMEELANFKMKIDEVVRIASHVTDITTQTHLLSLNASIEAARSGEHGRGFSVIAKEINNLALLTRNYNDDIKNVITDLKEGIQTVSESALSVSEYVGKQAEAILNTGNALNTIDGHLDDANTKTVDTFDIIKDVVEMSQEVTKAMDGVAVVLQENNARVQEITAMIQEESDNSKKLKEEVTQVTRLAEEIDIKINKFKTEQ